MPPRPEPAPGWFINGVVELTTTLTPRQLLNGCLRIEQQLGRRRVVGPDAPLSRPIDLDLLFYGGGVISEPGLMIPHPRLHLRRFVLAPLAELAPGLVHPVLHATVAALLNQLTDDGHTVRRLEPAAAAPPARPKV
jgi:2-amino-4-hydroxy-6-hydroxymethyldihydropteridine diphosphokinase